MESSPAAAGAMQVASPAPPSRSRDSRLLGVFDLPASWGYRKPMAFCRDHDAPPPPPPPAADAQQPNSSRSPAKGAAPEESPRTQCYQLRDRRAGRDSAEDAREHKKLWNMDGGAGPSKWSGGFSLQLSKEEIDDDFLAMTGRKPPRRHKRRTKSVQRQIDALCPGKSLPEVNRDRYKVNEKGGF
ncbi:hypothetical protein QYE76_015626 [Lolium multiflorum]|uniref:Uncharacterized protein n=1 Tax=Lolium multiflorum TaxID=4521 RepID=A0AAD8XA12_LOLMU|nr:hypothetical protein QYE76_015626 [Lolium multiflorum]